MSSVLLQIMIRAVKIRLSEGEELESILGSYPKLTDEDKEKIREALNG